MLAPVEAPKLNVGGGAAAAGAGLAEEVALPNPAPPPRLAKGLAPPADAPKGDEDGAAPNMDEPAAGAPGVPGVPLRLGSPRMTRPAAGVAGMEDCEDGESSSDPSSPSSLRICFSAWRFIVVELALLWLALP